MLAALVIGAVAAVSAAAVEQASDGVIFAAVNSKNGSTRIVSGPDVELRANEYLLEWNKVGPAGPAGEQGPPGVDGTDGADGADGSDGLPGLPGQDGTNGVDGTDGVSILWLGSIATPPTDPTLNNAYYNSTDNKSYIWNGSSWQVLAQDGADGADGSPGLPGADGADGADGLPGAPGANGIDGQDGTDGQDGLSIAWLGTLATAPSSPTLNNAYYDSTDKKSYMWDGDSWEIMAQDGTDGTTPTLGSWQEIPLVSTGSSGSEWFHETPHQFADRDGLVVVGVTGASVWLEVVGQGTLPGVSSSGQSAISVAMPVRKGTEWFIRGVNLIVPPSKVWFIALGD